MKTSLMAALLAAVLFAGAPLLRAADDVAAAVDAVPASSQPMTDAQIDQTFDAIFAQQQKINRMSAKVITVKKGGGVFNKPSTTLGYAYAKMPNCLLFIDRGELSANLPETQAAIILIDGTFLWDIKPGDDEGTMEAERLLVKNAGDRDINIAALLIGADVATGKQLREYYLLSGALEDFGAQGKSYHFGLKTIPGKEKKSVSEDVEVWIRVGEVIPWKIKSIRTTKVMDVLGTGNATKSKVTEAIKLIAELQTNLSTPPLPEYPAERFYFGELMKKFPKMKVVDGKGVPVDGAQLQQDLQNVLSRLKQPEGAK